MGMAIEQSQTLTQAVEAALAFACVPMQTGKLALHARFPHCVCVGARPGQHRVELRSCLRTATGWGQQIAGVLANGTDRQHIVYRVAFQNTQGAIVVA